MMKFILWMGFLGLLCGCQLGNKTTEKKQDQKRWTWVDRHIECQPRQPMSDHFAMSGREVDIIAEWKINDDLNFSCNRIIRFPMLRTLPDNTHSSLSHTFNDNALPSVQVNGLALVPGIVEKVLIQGKLEVLSRHGDLIRSKRTMFPSVASPAIIDYIELTNLSETVLNIEIPAYKHSFETKPGVFGVYTLTTEIIGDCQRRLVPGETLSYAVIRTGRTVDEPPYSTNPHAELTAREDYINSIFKNLVLETPEPTLNTLFAMTKLRSAESIFSTRGGLMHGPGGYNKYLAAIWANDQAEYANPFFPFLGDAAGNESALNAFRLFARYMNPNFDRIPSSIVAEGRGFWNGAGDRGDMAMIAHGATRFVLASGNQNWGKELLPLIQWCLEFSRRKTNSDSVIASNTDELEGRFPAGKANLCTSTLYYDALLRTADLLDALDTAPHQAETYRTEAAHLKKAILKYFGATVEGFETYRYYAENTVLRSWICMPMACGMNERAEGTVNALFSDKLWTGNGLLCASNNRKTYWDRSALYAFRGIFSAGYADSAIPHLLDYSRERLLGEHVPYPIEAYPEYNQSHLSAESALYCRIFTEGVFGIVPTGFDSFTMKMNLPSSWNQAALRKIHAFGQVFDIETNRIDNSHLKITLRDSCGKEISSAITKVGNSVKFKKLLIAE